MYSLFYSHKVCTLSLRKMLIIENPYLVSRIHLYTQRNENAYSNEKCQKFPSNTKIELFETRNIKAKLKTFELKNFPRSDVQIIILSFFHFFSLYTGYHNLRKNHKNSDNSLKNNPNRLKFEYVAR